MNGSPGLAAGPHRLAKTLGWLGVVAAAVFVGILARHRVRGRKAEPPAHSVPVYVRVTTAQSTTTQSVITALGTVTPLVTATASSRVDGQVEAVYFREGQIVRKGDLLARIDSRPYVASVAQVEGQKQRDEALLGSARQDLARYQPLAADHSIPKQQVDEQAWLVKQYEGAVSNDNGALQAAKVNLDYCRILSPLTGRAGLRSVDPGNIVHASSGAGIVTITQIHPVSVIFNLPEQNLTALVAARESHAAKVEAWERDDTRQIAEGKLSAIDNLVDTSTGTVRVRALFRDPQSKLFPNEFVNIHLVQPGQNAVVLPSAALQRDGDTSYVFVQGGDQKAHRRVVRVLSVGSEQVLLAGGIRAGERVLVQGLDRVQDGTLIHSEDAGR